ncbi:16787_t:CDS:2, partial [Gigaspora rosea]
FALWDVKLHVLEHVMASVTLDSPGVDSFDYPGGGLFRLS